MRTRFPLLHRAVARVLISTTTIMSVWSIAPPTIRVRAAAAEQATGGAQFYGPQRFTRTVGAPNVYTATITVPPGVNGPFTLHLQNGEPNGTNRILSATIEINGSAIAVPSDFSQTVAGFDRTIALNPSNTLRVILDSTPGAYLTITIGGATADTTSPSMALLAPVPASRINTPTPQIVIAYADGPAGNAAGVDINSLVVRVDGVDRSALFSRGATQATAQLTAATALGDGSHTLAGSISDRAGNIGTLTASFIVDLTAPTIETIQPPPGSFVNTGQPTIRVRYGDADGVVLSTLQVSVNGVDRTALFTKTATEAYATLDAASAVLDGPSTIVATIQDGVGNQGQTTSTFLVDTVAPSVEILSPGLEHYTSATALDVTGTVADGSPVSVTVNGVLATMTGAAFAAQGVTLGAGPDVVLQVTATDAAGNAGETGRTVHIDRVNPVVQITSPADGAFLSLPSIVVAGTIEDTSPSKVTVNETPAAVSGSSFTATLPAANGPAPVHVIVEDSAGNRATADIAVVVDTVAPALTVAAPAEGFVTNSGTVQVSGTVTDLTPVSVTINGVPVGAASGAFAAATPLSAGANTLTVTATDAAGNASSSIVHGSLDQIAPALAIMAPSNGTYLATSTPSIRVTFQDNGSIDTSSLRILLDGVDRTALFTAANGEAVATLPAVADGSHQIAATVADTAGNQSAAGTAFFTDTAGPALQITSPAANAYLKGPAVTVSGTVADLAIASVVVNGVGAAVANGTFSATVNAADGPLTIEAVATDAAGNQSTATTSVRLDSVAPVVTVTAPASGFITNGATVHVTGAVSDNSPVTLTITGTSVPVTAGSFAYDAPTGSDGALTIALAATDAAGNIGEASVSVTVDRAAPSIAISSPATGAFVRGPTVAVAGTISDASASTVVVNGVAATVSGSGFTATVPLSDGAATIDAIATDAAGNTATASASLTVDSAAPVITILQPGDGQYTNGTDIEVSGAVTDATNVTVTVNGVAAPVNGSNFTATVPVGNGSTSPVTVDATDAAGNTSRRTVTLRVDRVAPVVAIASPAGGTFRKGPILEVSGTVADGSPVLVEVNGQMAVVSGGAFTAQIPALDGPIAIEALARDAAGNTATARVDLTVDSAGPIIAVQSPANGTITNQASAHIVGSLVDVSPVTLRVGTLVVGLINNTFEFDHPLGAEGDRTVTLRATDAAGNESTFDVLITLDRTPPDLQITSPAQNAVLGSLPLYVQGLVYDATATSVVVNGVMASRTQDAWQAALASVDEGSQTLTIVATDAAGNTRTATRNTTIDLSAPSVAISAPSPDALTNASTVQVTGTAVDATLTSVAVNGVAAQLAGSTFSATVPLTEGDNHLIAVATDALSRTAQAEVVVNRDSTAPNVSIAAPGTLSRLRAATATIAASDIVALASVAVTLNGASIGNSTTAPFTVPLSVPAAVNVGATLALVATATDRAGNSSTATHTLRVIADGVVVGQALTDADGLPLAQAIVTMVNGAGGGSDNTETDARGGYSLPTADATVLLAISKAGMLTVERQVPIQNGVGTAVVDARLTKLDASGLTRLSAQGLPALLPLGWSPIAAFDVRGAAVGTTVTAPAPNGAQSLGPAALVSYRSSKHAWFVVLQQVTASSNGTFSFPAMPAGAYAIVVPDTMEPPIVVPAVDQPLTGVEMVALPAAATASGTVSPTAIPPAGGTATGQLAILSASPLPSGTVVQAQVTETYNLTSGAVASEEQRTQDIVLYRAPAADTNAALSAFFPIAPSRTYQTSALATGTVHLDILAGRESVRGQTGGSEPLTIEAGGVSMTVPAHALTGDTAVRVQPAILSSFLPGAAADSAPVDVTPLGEVVVDFSSQTLGLSAELSIAAPTDAPQGPVSYLLGRVVRIDGIPRVLIVAAAEIAGGRLASRTMVGLPGITVSGRYVFYRVGSDVGFVSGTLTASGSPVAGLVESDSLPFVGVAGANGHFIVATRAANVRLTGRVGGTALQGTAAVTVAANALTTRDIVLAGAATTSTVSPSDGATLVPVSSQVEIAATAPLDTGAVEAAIITLTDVGQNTTLTIRRVLSGSGQLLAIVPASALAAATTYRLDVSGLADVYGGTVSVAPVTFTTKADTAATFDPELVTVSFPDQNGLVHVVAPPGAVPALTDVLVVNAGNGVVASFQAGNDGSMNGDLTASIRDRLIVTVTDPVGRTFSFERSTYVAPDGTTGVGSGGGTIKSATTEAELQIPDGAIDDSAIFKLDGVDFAATFPNDPLPDIPGAQVGSSIKIQAQSGLQLKQEAKLAFAKPAEAPAGAFYYVYRRLQGPDGRIAYETLDHAFPDPETGKIVTASPPFSGYINSIDGYSLSGANFGGAVGSMLANYAIVMWAFDEALPGRAIGGVITGKVYRTKFDPGATTPSYEPVSGAIVSGVDAGGEPLYAFTTGASVALSQPDGTFTMIDRHYQGGSVTLTATFEGVTRTATAFESNPQDLKSPGLGVYRNIATANFTFPAIAPAAPPPAIDVRMFTTVNGALKETKNGVVVAGTPVTFGFNARNTTVSSASLRDTSLTVHEDTLKTSGMPQISEAYTPPVAGSYTLNAVAQQPFGPPLVVPFTFRVIASGGNATANLPNDAPAVVTGLTVPRNNAQGVQPTVFPQVAFTEPVKRIPGHVTLRDAGGQNVPFVMSADGPDGPIDAVTTDAQVVTSLTIQPIQPLLYNTQYTLTLTADIVDLDKDANDAPAPKPLQPYTSTFTTFGPEQVGQSAESYASPAVVVLGDRAYLATPWYYASSLKIFDISDPAQPYELVTPEQILQVGSPYDLVGDEESPLTGGRVVAMTTGPMGIPYRPSNVHLYDVSTDSPQWIGAVTLGNSPTDGIARRTVLRGDTLYAVTLGIGKGIQVVDLNQAMANFQEATSEGTQNIKYYTMLRQLGLEGQGFGQDAIRNTIFVDTGSGQNSRLWDLDVADLQVDGIPARVVAATGASALVLADPFSSEVLFNGRVYNAQLQPALNWGYSIALAHVGDRDVAAVVGFATAASSLQLVIVDVTNPRLPVAIGSLPLASDQVDVRARLIIRDGVVYIGGLAATTLVSIADPEHPKQVGVITGVAGNLALTSNNLLFGVGQPLTSTRNQGLRDAVLGPTAIVRRVTPSTLVYTETNSTTEKAIDIDAAVVPSGVVPTEARIDIYRDNSLIESLPAAIVDGKATATWPAGKVVTRGVPYTARAVMTAEDSTLESGPAHVPLVDLILLDKRGEIVDAPIASEPRPVITLTPLTMADVVKRGSQADVTVKGTITDPLADIVADHQADITEVVINGTTAPVTPVSQGATPQRPYAFKGEFRRTVTIDLSGGPNVVTVEATNAADERSSASVTVNVNQTTTLAPRPYTLPLFDTKSLDPFTLVIPQLRTGQPDTIVLYHGGAEPTGSEPVLTETGPDTLIFSGVTPELGDATVELDGEFSLDPSQADVIDVRITSTTFAMVDDSLLFAESGAATGVFRTAALRLTDRQAFEFRLTQPLDPARADAPTVRHASADEVSLTELTPESNIFTGNVPGLGQTVVWVRSLEAVPDASRVMYANVSSATLGLQGYYVKLRELTADSGRFVLESDSPTTEDIAPVPVLDSTIAGVETNQASEDAGTFEPVWVVARGLRPTAAPESFDFNGDTLKLTTTPLGIPSASANTFAATAAPQSRVPQVVRSVEPLAFLRTSSTLSARNVRNAFSGPPEAASAPQAPQYNAAVTTPSAQTPSVTIQRSIVSLALSRQHFIIGARTESTIRMRIEGPASLDVAGVCVAPMSARSCAPAGVTVAKGSNTRDGRALRFSMDVTTDKSAQPGPRTLIIQFNDGTSVVRPGVINVTRPKLVIFAIDGLSKETFDAALAMRPRTEAPAMDLRIDPTDSETPQTGLQYIFKKSLFDHISVSESTTFPPITFTRWTTVFSGKTPADTKVPALQWLNRYKLVDQKGRLDQGTGLTDAEIAYFVARDPSAFNRHSRVEFVYDKLRAAGLTNGVFLQQSGIGVQPPNSDNWWEMGNLFLGVKAFVAGKLPSAAFNEARVLDEGAFKMAANGWRKHGAFDLTVIYLPGLDHYLHYVGGNGGETARSYFRQVLHPLINGYLELNRYSLDAMVFGVMADHGHIDVNDQRALDLTTVGPGLFGRQTMLRTLQSGDGRVRVGKMAEPLAVEGAITPASVRPNVVFVPQFGMANIYIAGNTHLLFAPADWSKPPSLAELKPFVDRLHQAYMTGSNPPVSHMLVRVPGPDGQFNGSTYRVLARTYSPKGNFAVQLLDLQSLANQSMDDGSDPQWAFNDPVRRINEFNSRNSGDIVLLANMPAGFQFGDAYKSQHGSLTYKDSIVPVAFGYPRTSGGNDTVFDPIVDFFSQWNPSALITEPIEARAIEHFLIRQ